MKKRVLVAMSGGVDSSVAAWILKKQGYECIGATMKLYHNETVGCKGHTCCSLEDVEDARSVARKLDIPYYVFNFSSTFDQMVMRKFAEVYQQGSTPNPCIDCNRYLKFGQFLHRAQELGIDYIATGHYASVIQDPSTGRWSLQKGDDPDRDQSYVLAAMTQEQLARTLFPLGSLRKSEVRRIAEEAGFCNARKHDSQDICFVPDGDYAGFLERYTGHPSAAGDILGQEGQVGHLSRPQFYKGDRFHFACNIVVNSSMIRYGFTDDKLPGIGEIHHETFYPKVEGCELTPYEAFQMTPLDPSTLSEPQRRNLLLDSDEWWDRPNARTEDGVLILSPDDPDPDDLIPSERIRGIIERVCKGFRKQEMPEVYRPEEEDDDELDDLIFEYTTRPSTNLKETIREIRGSKDRDAENYDSGSLCERVLHRSKITTHDWRSLLNHFIMDETKDYSFTPPDRRLQDLDFFLPDYNESETPRLNVLFMVDISASLKDQEVAMAAAEICAAIEQFGGMLSGSIGFFDSVVRRVVPITSAENLLQLTPYSGGGTSFQCIFDYVREHLADNVPSEIVIMTDGKSDFPEYEASSGIPVLWLLTNNRVRIPWGQAAYFRK